MILPLIFLSVFIAIIAVSGFARDIQTALKTGCYIDSTEGVTRKVYRDREPGSFYFLVILWGAFSCALEIGIIFLTAMVLRTQLDVPLEYLSMSVGLAVIGITILFLRIKDRKWKGDQMIIWCFLCMVGYLFAAKYIFGIQLPNFPL